MADTITDAKRAIALMHGTPNGGLAVLSGKEDDFDAIPCASWTCQSHRCDYYVYDNGPCDDLILAIPFEGEEFHEISALPDDAE